MWVYDVRPCGACGLAAFAPWASGEPNNNGNNDSCGMLYSNAKMNDGNCADSYPYICSKFAAQYYTLSFATATTDTVCSVVGKCLADEYETRAPTPTADRV